MRKLQRLLRGLSVLGLAMVAFAMPLIAGNVGGGVPDDSITSEKILDETIQESDLLITTYPTDGQLLSYDDTTGLMQWGTSAAGAPTDATYLTLSVNGTLTVERVLTAGEGIDFTDGGAGSTLTVSGEDATDTNKGIASFGSHFTVTSGAVALTSVTYDLLPLASVTNGDTTHVASVDSIYDFCETTQDYIKVSELNSEAELESLLVDVTDVFTNLDGALNDDDVTETDIKTALSDDFHNIGGTDDDVPEAGDYTALTGGTGITMSPTGTVNCDLGVSIVSSEITDETIEETDLHITTYPLDAYVLSYDNATGLMAWKADTNTTYTGGTGITLTDTVFSNDLGTTIESAEITDSTIEETDLHITVYPTDGQILSYDNATGLMKWTAAGAADTFAGFEIDGVSQTAVAPTFDFDGTTFSIVEDPANDFDINVNTADTDTKGVLTSTDWNTFNNKLSAEVDGDTTNEINTITAGDANSTSGLAITLVNGTGITTTASGDSITITSSLGTSIVSAEITDGTIEETDLNVADTPVSGEFLGFNGTTFAWSTPAGAGDVSKVGTPVNNQVGVWTGDGTLEGDAGLTFDGSTLTATTVVADLTGNADTVTNATFTTALTVNTGTLTLTANVANSSVLTIGAGASSVSGSNTGDNTVATSGDAAADFFGAGVTAVTDATTCTDLEGSGLSITTGTLNCVITTTEITDETITETDFHITTYPTDGQVLSYVNATGLMTWTAAGAGDMLKAAYDLDDNSMVDTAEDLFLTSQAQGTITYFDGSNWVVLPVGTDGQVLECGGAAANPSWETASGGTSVFSYYSPTDTIHVDTSVGADTSDFVVGSPMLDDDGIATHDYRMFFDKSKGFFGAGRAQSTQWDDASRGVLAIGLGANNTASGTYSAIGGGNTNTATTDTTTVSGGQNNDVTATAGYIGGGDGGTVNATYGVVSGGYQNTASGGYATVGGGRENTASGIGSTAEGYESNASLYGQHAHSAGEFAAIGDSQYSRCVLRADTPDATPETLYVDNNVSYKLVVPANTSWTFVATLCGRADVETSGSYRIEGGIRRDGANNTTLVGAGVTVTTIAEDEATWDVTAEADNATESLAIKVTGHADYIVRWTATVHLTEIGY